MNREAGILLALASLPGTLGIGDMGKDVYRFLDMLDASKARLWQLLPLNPVGYGNSPYQTYSSFAGDEIYISIEDLYQDLGLKLEKIKVEARDRIDYTKARERKDAYLRKAYQRFVKDEAYEHFCKESFWLDEYAQFMALRKRNDYKAWLEWHYEDYDPEEMAYHKFLQYIFFSQWQRIKAYANHLDIRIVGDIPIYLGHDSAEVYFHRDLFYLDKDGKPELVAGVPPDYFSETGQLWGNPLYNWERMAQDGYGLWIARLAWNKKLFDVIRIDHFRAFDTYWAIAGDAKSAKQGKWRFGPAHHFFNAVYQSIPDIHLVAEDLGDLRPEVLALRDDYGLMGMQIIQFALHHREIIRDEKMPHNLLIYTGTHDNETIGGWLKFHRKRYRERVYRDLEKRGIPDKNLIDKICHYTLSLNADWAILPIQDIMRLPQNTRLNYPGTVGSPNWEWKLKSLNDSKEGFERFTAWVLDTKRNKDKKAKEK